MTTSLRDDIAARFVDTQNDEKLMSECLSLCQNYNITADDLFFKWEAITYNSAPSHLGSASPMIFTSTTVHALKSAIQRENAAKKAKEHQARASLNSVMMRPKTEAGLRFSRVSAIASGTPARPGVGSGHAVRTPRVNFKGPKDTTDERIQRKYRYMYEKITERSEVLDEQIDEIGELVRERYSIDELGDPSSASEEDVIVVGRICSDADSSSSSTPKLHDMSIFLESSRMMGSGTRVPLRFNPTLKLRGTTQGAGGLGFFPGAIVGLKGKNGGGGWFAVSEILGIPPLTVSSSSSGSQNDVKPEPGNGAFTMCIASGPYTPDTDLKYTPFASLIEKAKTSRPAVLLLLGPFIDSMHQHIKSGEIDHAPTEIFRQTFKEQLRDFLTASPDSLVLLVPSVRDILSDHPVFPQCELGSELSADARIKMLPNPCRFTVNGVSFAASSVDVLFHLRNQEFVKRAVEIDPTPCTDSPGTDIMANMCRHLFQQRSFYPIYPVPTELSHEVNLDVTHSEGLRLDDGNDRNDHAPDVLILPSKLKHFAKVLDSTMAINPSFLSKGTYALLQVGEALGGLVKERMTCEVVKL